jgi:hypothetical protein
MQKIVTRRRCRTPFNINSSKKAIYAVYPALVYKRVMVELGKSISSILYGEYGMKLNSKFALALSTCALAISSLALAPAAYAKKEPKTAAPTKPKLNFSKGFLAAYQPAIDAFFKKKDIPASIALLPSLKAAIANEDDRFEAGGYFINVGTQAKDMKIQIEGLDLLLASTSTPADERAKFNYYRGAFAYDSKDYANAESFLQKSHSLGYRGNDVQYLIANAQAQQKKFAEAQQSMREAVAGKRGAGAAVPTIWFAQAKSYAAKQKDRAGEIYWGKEMIKSDTSPEAYHDALFPFMSYTELSTAELLDAFRLVRETKSLLFSHEFKGYIEAADRKRSPAEVIAVIDEGLAKGILDKADRSISDDVVDAKLNMSELAKNWDSDEQFARKQSTGTQAMLFADRVFAFGEFARAAAMYQVAIDKGGITTKDGANVNDQAVMRLAISQVKLNNLTGAKATLAKITDPKRKMLADYWDIYLTNELAKTAAVPAAAS